MNSGQYGGVHLPTLSKVNKSIIIVFVGLFLLNSVLKSTAGINLAGILGLSGSQIFNGMIFEFFTYPIIGTSLLEVVFNSMLLWFIGSEIESMWGTSRYLKFMATSLIGGGLIFFAISVSFLSSSVYFSVPLTGMTGFINALLLAYAILFPDKTFLFMLIFPVKAKIFCSLLIAMQLYIGIFSPGGVLAWGHLGAMFSGFMFMIIASQKSMKRGPFDGLFNTKNGKNNKKGRGKLTLVKNDDDKPKYWH